MPSTIRRALSWAALVGALLSAANAPIEAAWFGINFTLREAIANVEASLAADASARPRVRRVTGCGRSPKVCRGCCRSSSRPAVQGTLDERITLSASPITAMP